MGAWMELGMGRICGGMGLGSGLGFKGVSWVNWFWS